MKTKLFIAFLLIASFTFAQSKTNSEIKKSSSSQKSISKNKTVAEETKVKKVIIRKDTTEKSSKRTIKIGGTEKPYRQVKPKKGDTTEKTYRYYKKRKLAEEPLKANSANRKRRVEILKSNKQGDPNKKN